MDALPVQRFTNRTVYADDKVLCLVGTHAPVLLVGEAIALG